MMRNPSKCARGRWVALWTTSTRTTAISSIASSASWTIPSTTNEELAGREDAAEMGAVGAGYDLGDPAPGRKDVLGMRGGEPTRLPAPFTRATSGSGGRDARGEPCCPPGVLVRA